jgi:hypothetical protein
MANTGVDGIQDLLSRFGLSARQALDAVPAMFLAPGATLPDSPESILIVTGVQNGLNSMGAGLPVTGYLDSVTSTMLSRAIGAGWSDLPWYDIYTRLYVALSSGTRLNPQLVQVSTSGTNWLMWGIVGFVAYKVLS